MNAFLACRIVYDPERPSDGPLVRDTGVSVDLVLEALAERPDAEFVLARFPSLEEPDILAAIEFARQSVHQGGNVRLFPSISDLGWTREQAARVRQQLQPFADDWDDPAMNAYDDALPATR